MELQPDQQLRTVQLFVSTREPNCRRFAACVQGTETIGDVRKTLEKALLALPNPPPCASICVIEYEFEGEDYLLPDSIQVSDIFRTGSAKLRITLDIPQAAGLLLSDSRSPGRQKLQNLIAASPMSTETPKAGERNDDWDALFRAEGNGASSRSTVKVDGLLSTGYRSGRKEPRRSSVPAAAASLRRDGSGLDRAPGKSLPAADDGTTLGKHTHRAPDTAAAVKLPQLTDANGGKGRVLELEADGFQDANDIIVSITEDADAALVEPTHPVPATDETDDSCETAKEPYQKPSRHKSGNRHEAHGKIPSSVGKKGAENTPQHERESAEVKNADVDGTEEPVETASIRERHTNHPLETRHENAGVKKPRKRKATKSKASKGDDDREKGDHEAQADAAAVDDMAVEGKATASERRNGEHREGPAGAVVEAAVEEAVEEGNVVRTGSRSQRKSGSGKKSRVIPRPEKREEIASEMKRRNLQPVDASEKSKSSSDKANEELEGEKLRRSILSFVEDDKLPSKAGMLALDTPQREQQLSDDDDHQATTGKRSKRRAGDGGRKRKMTKVTEDLGKGADADSSDSHSLGTTTKDMNSGAEDTLVDGNKTLEKSGKKSSSKKIWQVVLSDTPAAPDAEPEEAQVPRIPCKYRDLGCLKDYLYKTSAYYLHCKTCVFKGTNTE